MKNQLRDSYEQHGKVKAFTSTSNNYITGTVYGGNSSAKVATSDDFNTWTFPDYKPYIFALENTEFPQQPSNWTTLRLPSNFKHGDKISNALPPGIGYVRISYPSQIDFASWLSDDQKIGNDKDSPGMDAPYLVAAKIKSGSSLLLFWSEKVSYSVSGNTDSGDADIPGNYILVSASGTDPVTVTAHNSTTNNVSNFSLSRAITEDEVVTLSIRGATQPGVVKDANNNFCVSYLDYSRVTLDTQRDSYILVVNFSGQGLKEGDSVILRNSFIYLSDKSNVSKKIYDVLPVGGAGNLPHRHMDETSGISGGGFAFATPLPASWTGINNLGLSNLIQNV